MPYVGFELADKSQPYPDTMADPPACEYQQCSHGWFWPVSAYFMEQLDLRCMLARIGPPFPNEPGKKQPVWQWSQGGAFCFEKGHMLPSPALDIPKICYLQVVDAKPAVPGKTLHNEIINQRDPGLVVCDLLTFENGQQIRQKQPETTQDGFVHFLITGQLPETDEIYAKGQPALF